VTSSTTWLVGAGGLLGTAVARALEGPRFEPSRPLRWTDPTLHDALRGAVAEFAGTVAQGGTNWQLCWCAGAGVVGTRAPDLARESAALQLVLECLREQPSLGGARGSILLASSAGGVHAGVAEQPTTETSPALPLSDYGRTKLAQEQLLAQLTADRPLVSWLVARYSNLYGPGQKLDKPQGLISQLARCAVFSSPAHIFVPLDTIRDYLYADDAGLLTVDALARLAALEPGTRLTKIFASEREASIASLLGIFRSMTKRQLKVVLGVRSVSALQPTKLTFRSGVWRDQIALATTELVDGIARVYRHQLRTYQLGRLPRPA
jgi:UDP-glucose 4-epimerase